MVWFREVLSQRVSRPIGIFLMVFIAASAAAFAQEEAEKKDNFIKSIATLGSDDSPQVEIKTAFPIGFRYTIYDSYDPVRVIVDLPGVDVSLANGVKADQGPLTGIRASSFDLPSGKLGRIEVLLSREIRYRVSSESNTFTIHFGESDNSTALPTDAGQTNNISMAAASPQLMQSPAPQPTVLAKKIKSVQVGKSTVKLEMDGSIDNYQYFHLRAPARLVVDIYGVKPAFNERLFKVPDGFNQIRVGDAANKTRFVFDAKGEFPGHRVIKENNSVIVSWSGATFSPDVLKTVSTSNSADKGAARGEAEPHQQTQKTAAAANSSPPASSPTESAMVEKALGANASSSPEMTSTPSVNPAVFAKTADNTAAPKAGSEAVAVPAAKKSAQMKGRKDSVSVDAVDFKVENGKSILTIRLSGEAEIVGPVIEKEIVYFGIVNATISRALRRTIDASSFPSAVKRVIPYLNEGGKEVRFTTELKGVVPYSLQQEKGMLTLVVDNLHYAEPLPPIEKIAVPVPKTVPAPEIIADESPVAPLLDAPVTVAASSVSEIKPNGENPKGIQVSHPADKTTFSGEKISLVFDDANIRNILQLIGEVSNLNIIAGEDVKGTISLRLIDVPWDQALSLILDSKNLGMLREGNVVRIMPKEQIRTLRQAEMTAVKEEKQLEPVITEVISISYTALGNVTTPAKEVLTDRGKITEDTRNKQIIVTDIPSVIADVRKLAAILDTPERQVMIEARIVEASSSFGRDLGVKWGISYSDENGGPGGINNANVGLGGGFLIAPPAVGSVMSNAGLGSGITFGRVGIDSTVLDLRISALESSGYGKVISTPRVSTLNGGTASISQGTKIPYQSTGDDGKAKTEFVDANLSLTVQPVINPDDSIILDISATNSSIGSTVSTGAGSAPAIDTKEAKTKVIVRNGETTVVGGIFVESENTSQAGVPLLMKIPIIGHLFRSDNKSSTRSELLVFITPRIVQ